VLERFHNASQLQDDVLSLQDDTVACGEEAAGDR
jgi:hypothetical protein